jgi:hypothetical protein
MSSTPFSTAYATAGDATAVAANVPRIEGPATDWKGMAWTSPPIHWHTSWRVGVDHRAVEPADRPDGDIAEANGRSTLYLGTLSSAVIAIAFVGQASQLGTEPAGPR